MVLKSCHPFPEHDTSIDKVLILSIMEVIVSGASNWSSPLYSSYHISQVPNVGIVLTIRNVYPSFTLGD